MGDGMGWDDIVDDRYAQWGWDDIVTPTVGGRYTSHFQTRYGSSRTILVLHRQQPGH